MKSTFSRALLGFIILTAAVSAMAFVGLRTAETYAADVWAIPLVIILLSMVVVIGIYGSTLHKPIMAWVKEPAQEKARFLAAAEAKTRREETTAAEE